MSRVRDWHWHIRLILRGLRRTPGFSAAVVAILTVGMGANLTIFSVLDRLLLSTPPQVQNAEEVRRIYTFGVGPFSGDEPAFMGSLSYPDYRAVAAADGIDAAAGFGRRSMTLAVGGRAESIAVEFATASYFDLLGVSPALGRFFSASEDALGAPAGTVVLGYRFWQRRFGGDEAALGTEVVIGKGRYRVVGIAPAGFTGVNLAPVDAWVPLVKATEFESGDGWINAHGWYMMQGIVRVRRAPDVVAAAATAAYRAGREQAGRPAPDTAVVLADIRAARGPEPPAEIRVAQFLGILTVLVLLISAANVGNLTLARGMSRRTETAVRSALGAGRARIVADGMLEVAILASIAAALSFWLAVSAGGLLLRVLLPDSAESVVPGAALIFAAIGLVVATMLFSGVVPAWQSARKEVMPALRSRGGSMRQSRARAGLLMLQSAFSVIILIAAGLFVRSARQAAAVDLFLDLDVVAVDIENDAGVSFGSEVSTLVAESMARLRTLPSVQAATAVTLPPFSGRWGVSVARSGVEPIEWTPAGPFVYGVTGGYFDVVGTPIVRGRPLDDRDAAPGAALVAVVGETLATRLWPDGDPVGECLIVRPEAEETTCTTVVGVAADFRVEVDSPTLPLLLYLSPSHPGLGGSGAGDVLVKPRDGATAAQIGRDIMQLSGSIRFAHAESLGDKVAPQMRSWRLGATLLGAFGVLALVVTGAGLYSSLAFEVAGRRREFGIRIALGAHRRRIIQTTLVRQLRVVSVGIVLGLAVGVSVATRAASLLFHIQPGDPLVLAGVTVTLLGVAAAAVAIPARRAMRVDPTAALRG